MDFTQEKWETMMSRYPPGTPVSGVVIACPVFGVFVKLDELPEVPALLELIHFALVESEPERRLQHPADYPAVGSRIEARVAGWCLKPKDVRLTQLNHLNWSHKQSFA